MKLIHFHFHRIAFDLRCVDDSFFYVLTTTTAKSLGYRKWTHDFFTKDSGIYKGKVQNFAIKLF